MSRRLNKYEVYLEKLRQSGIINMYGASPFLEKKFGISHDKANEILAKWMSEYKREDYAHIKLAPEEELEFYF